MMLKRLLASALLLLAFCMPIAANDIEVHGYTESGSISATIDGQEMSVPDDMANRHRQMIAAWEALGNKILDYRPPAPSRKPSDYPLQRYQFMAMLEIAGLKAVVDQAIDTIDDPVQRAVARARYENEQTFDRQDPLLVTLAAAGKLTTEQVDVYWMQAKDL